MKPDGLRINTEGQESIAILVHGTFAGDTQDSGQMWWQSGSPAATLLGSKLPAGVRVARDSEVFHWSGENSERARNKAAVRLLQHLEKQESAGLDYHLVGHSHGGSVIWNALKLATVRRKPLDGLRSWTTIGTPFLQHRSRSAWNLLNLAGLVLGLLLLRPAVGAGAELTTILWNAVTGKQATMELRPDEQVGYVAVLRAPVLTGLEQMGVAIERTDESVRVGHFDPAGDMSLMRYLFASSEGLLLLVATIIAAYVFLHLALICLRPALESYRVRAELKLNQLTFEEFGACWHGIWSPDDEAINGLRATLDVTVSFVAKLQPRESMFVSDVIGLFSRPYFWVLAPIFNWLIHPAVDAKIRGIVTRAAQGNDRPMATVVDVSPCPLGDCRGSCPPLPKALTGKLLSYADKHARDIGPKLRRLLAKPSFTGGVAAFSRDLTGKELVHTSYFEHSEILDLIACNIALGDRRTSLDDFFCRVDHVLVAWFVESKSLTFGGKRTPGAKLSTPDSEPERREQRQAA